MNYLDGIWLAVLGILAAPNLIIAKKPEAKEIIGKMAPYQGWMGAASVVYGVIVIIRFLSNMRFFSVAPIGFISWLASGLLLLALGLLLGVGIIKTFVSAPAAVEKLDLTIAKLAPKQGTLGRAGICVGIWIIVYRIIGAGF